VVVGIVTVEAIAVKVFGDFGKENFRDGARCGVFLNDG
jgi:hypothetical protein